MGWGSGSGTESGRQDSTPIWVPRALRSTRPRGPVRGQGPANQIFRVPCLHLTKALFKFPLRKITAHHGSKGERDRERERVD